MRDTLLSLLEEGRLKSYTKMALSAHGLRPLKRLGQNFIVSKKIIDKYIEILRGLGDDPLLEVGTGLGALTFYVARDNPRRTIVTIEKDPEMYRAAQGVLSMFGNVILVLGDAMELLESAKLPTVFSSTPYHLSTEIILGVARNNNVVSSVLGVQREVGLRVVGRPGTGNYGRISVISQLIFDVEIRGHFPPRAFYPQPEVSGVILLLRRRKKYERETHGWVERLTECAFSYRNKLAEKVIRFCLRKLKGNSPPLEPTKFGINEKTRVRDLTPEAIESLVVEYLL